MNKTYVFVGDNLFLTVSMTPIVQSMESPDFLAYLAWVGEGNVADVLPAPPDATDARLAAAKSEAFAVTQLRNATPDQVTTYVTTLMSNGVPEATAVAAANALPSNSVAALVASLKPLLVAIIHAQYRAQDLLVMEGQIDIAFRDATWPDLPDLTQLPAQQQQSKKA